jgi:DNA processing protein
MSGARLSESQRLDWLRLIRSESVGPRTFRALVNRYGGAAGALEALPGLARKAGRLMVKVTTRAEAEDEIARADAIGARFVAMGEPDYPRALAAIDTAPPLICVRGGSAILAKPAIALVGSRNSSAAGLAFTARLARAFGDAGFAVASGLARGIDTAAHKASLESGTIAVLAGGHERIYPSENKPLLERIVEQGGAVISEMPIGWEPRGRDFPRRNRIVSGLSLGIVVVEAARRSGSLITARFALEQGREVFAVPGSPLDPRAEGCNDLIREGATLCAEADHVLAALLPLVDAPPPTPEMRETGRDGAPEPLWEELDLFDDDVPPPPTALVGDLEEEGASASAFGDGGTDPASVIAALLGPSPVGVDDLSRQSGIPVRTVQLVLLDLELAGRLERHGGNTVALVE